MVENILDAMFIHSEIYINCVRLLFNYNFVFKYCDICNVNEYVINLLFLFQINYLLLTDNIQFKRKTGK